MIDLYDRFVLRKKTRPQLLKMLEQEEQAKEEYGKKVMVIKRKKGAKRFASMLYHQDTFESYYDVLAAIRSIKKRLKSLS